MVWLDSENMNRMYPIIAALALLSASDDAAAARIDRAQFPPSEHVYLYYFSTAAVTAQRQANLAKTLNYVCASLSRDSNLESQLPVRVGPTLYRIDTRYLKWETTLAKALVAHYPYAKDQTSKGFAPLVTRADWFCANIGDETVTKESQYLLLYGKALANEAEFLRAWNVGREATDAFGFLEGGSGVKRQGAGLERVMETRPTGRGASFQTFDSRRVAGETDALEFPDKRPPKHDATEIIAPIIKVGKDADGNAQAGALLAFFLANGNRAGVAGARQAAAPVDIVEDSLNLRGYDIRNYIDCVSCHSQGLKLPTLDKYREAIVGGVLIKTYDKQEALNIDRYYQSAFLRDVKRGIEDYAVAVKMCNGLTPEANAAMFWDTVVAYDADVTREQAALELGTTPRELSLAIAYYIDKYKDRNIRPALLSEGQKISRSQFEENAYKFQEMLRVWSLRN